MKAILISQGIETELTDGDYNRIEKRAKQDPKFYTLDNGKIINLDQITAVVPVPAQTAENAEVIAVTTKAPEDEAPVDDLMDASAATEPVGDQADKITADDIKDILKSQDLTQKDFAAKIGYSPSAVRMAVQEGRISDEFSQKVLEVFKPVESEDAEG